MARADRDLDSPVPVIIVHGGAGADPADGRDELRDGMREAAAAGWRVLAGGGTALDAVEAAVRVLEDHPRFNAGRGSVLTTDGAVEMDASIMEGTALRCGAVAVVSRVANPVSLARRVLEDGRHVLMAGEGAHRFALESGFAAIDPATLVTERQHQRWQALAGAGTPVTALPGAGAVPAPAASRVPGTVGAAARDRHGTIAAATSTGGMAGKRPGRVGDSALIGCGTYAETAIGGVSCTGTGEAIIRVVLARRTLDDLAASGDPAGAAQRAVELLVTRGGGEGGLIVVDARGRIGYAHSTPLMPVAWMSSALPAPVVPF